MHNIDYNIALFDLETLPLFRKIRLYVFMSFSDYQSRRPGLFQTLIVFLIHGGLMMLSLQDMDILFAGQVTIPVFLIGFYYWMIHQPSLMPLWFVFLAGCCLDIFGLGLLGIHAFGLTIMALILMNIRRIILSQPEIYQFLVFVLMIIGFMILQYLLISLVTWRWQAILPIALSGGFLIMAYIPIVFALKTLHRVIFGHGRHGGFL